MLPPQLVAFGFLAVILIGSILLALPVSWAGEPPRFMDVVFTATSATCVTGLITRDTATEWSWVGQLVILILVQIGGLGIMSLSALVQLLLNRRLGTRGQNVLSQALDLSMRHRLRDVIRIIGLSTLIIESVGFMVLLVLFLAGGMPFARAIPQAGFHSISAFCNAGFSLNSDSLVGHGDDPAVLLTVALLVILGGLGFTVYTNLYLMFKNRGKRPPERMTLQTRIVLWTTAALLAGGAAGLYLTECLHGGPWAGDGVSYRLSQAAFHSVSARTAGFNSASIAAMTDAGLFLLIVLMFIGASPGSTGGGMKTTSLAAIFAAIVAMARHRQTVEWGDRSIPRMTVYRAMAVGALFLICISGGTLSLLLTEGFALRDALFETTSALCTVGLSTGVTPHLSTSGKILVTLLMYVGRLGPLTLLVSLGSFGARGEVEYPEAPVAVG
jgi:trk system potassium uptake protein TrkH